MLVISDPYLHLPDRRPSVTSGGGQRALPQSGEGREGRGCGAVELEVTPTAATRDGAAVLCYLGPLIFSVIVPDCDGASGDVPLKVAVN